MSKVILITGASSGMGKDTAKRLILEGNRVYAAARRLENMAELKEIGGFPIQLDITNDLDVQKTVDLIMQRENKIDVLWNNAGFGLYGAVEDIPLDDARHQFEVNLFGLANLTQKVLPHMRGANSGIIINTSSMGGKIYMPLGAWYHASKHALEGWSDCLRLELKGFNIHVVIMEPGIIATAFGGELNESLMRYSGNGPYKSLANTMARVTQKSYQKKANSSPTSVISDLVSKIINDPNPKTRYRVGKWAKPLVWFRTYLGDRLFDKIIMAQLKK